MLSGRSLSKYFTAAVCLLKMCLVAFLASGETILCGAIFYPHTIFRSCLRCVPWLATDFYVPLPGPTFYSYNISDYIDSRSRGF